ncbi:MAG: methyltransferase family protein, partial [bacterium]
MKGEEIRKMKTNFNIMSFLIGVIKFLIPLTVIFLKLLNPHVPNGWSFVAFVMFIVIERSYETFCDKKFKKILNKLNEDFCFKTVTLAYTIMVFIMMFEFFLTPREIQISFLLFVTIVYFLSLSLRFWGIKTLGDSWQIRDFNRQLITNKGPYQYIRHPIYLGFIIEVLVVPLIPFTLFALLYSIIFFVPLILF